MSDDLDAELLSISSRNNQDTGAKKSLDDDESSDSLMFSEDDSVSDGDDSSQDEELDEEDLAGMSELQRESIMAERFQKQKSREERENIKNQLRAKQKKKSLANEQKFETDSSNRSKRVISNKSAKKQDIAMSDLVAKRAKNRKEELELDLDESGDTSEDGEKDPGDSSANEDDNQEPEQPFSFSLADMHAMQLKRSDLKRYLNKPFFQTMIIGYFVRVGFERRDHKEVYRATKIVAVKESTRTYSFGGITTKKVLTLKYGNFERDYSMEYVSNAEIDQSEFDRWMLTITDAGVAPPTREDVELKRINRTEMDNFVFDNQKLNEHLKNNKAVELPSQKIADLRMELLAAKSEGNKEEIRRLKQQIQEAEREHQESFRQKVNDKISTSIYALNQRNRQLNTQITQTTHDTSEDFNPFKRRKTESTLITQTGKSSQDNTSSSQQSSQDLNTSVDEISSFLPSADVEHNFEINVDFGKLSQNSKRPVGKVTPAKLSSAPIVNLPQKRTLSLKEYKAKRGLA